MKVVLLRVVCHGTSFVRTYTVRYQADSGCTSVLQVPWPQFLPSKALLAKERRNWLTRLSHYPTPSPRAPNGATLQDRNSVLQM